MRLIFPQFHEDYVQSASWLLDEDVEEIPFELTCILSKYISSYGQVSPLLSTMYKLPLSNNGINVYKPFLEAIVYPGLRYTDFIRNYGQSVFNEYQTRFGEQHPCLSFFTKVKDLETLPVKFKPEFLTYGLKEAQNIPWNIPMEFRVKTVGKKREIVDPFTASKEYYKDRMYTTLWKYSKDVPHPLQEEMYVNPAINAII